MKKIISIFVTIAFLGSSSLAQERTSAKSPKDEGTGTIIAVLITGGGHFYAEETGTGLTLLLVGGGSFLGGALLGSAIPKKTDIGFGITVEEYNTTFLWLGLAVYAGTWIYGIVDAPKAVRRYNQKYGLSYDQINFQPYVSHNSTAGLQYGLRLSYNLR
jgi:hypothetical protein